MKKVFLYAYDRVNLGDDLFIRSILTRYPKTRFYLWSDKVNQINFADQKNIRVIDTDAKFVRLLHKIRPSLVARYKAHFENISDAVVYIGGSIFMEYDNWKQILSWWEYEAQKSRFLVLGCNFGPYHTQEFLEGHKRLFAGMTDVCFRDSYSGGLFEDVTTVRQAPDILFGQKMPERKTQRKQVFFSVIDCAHKSEGNQGLSDIDEQYYQNLLLLARGFLADGYKVILSSFCKEEGDENTVSRMMNDLKDEKKVCPINYNGRNSSDILRAMADSDAVIASRFHAVILSLAAGVAVYPMIYSDKTKHVLEDIGYTGAYTDIRNMTPIDYKECRQELSAYHFDKDTMKKLKKGAKKHFKMLDGILR